MFLEHLLQGTLWHCLDSLPSPQPGWSNNVRFWLRTMGVVACVQLTMSRAQINEERLEAQRQVVLEKV